MITVIGEALVDLVDAGDRVTFTAHAGGSPYNVAIGLARLAQTTELMARLSTDTFGQLIRAEAIRSGVGLGSAPRASEASSLAVVSLDATGQARYEFRIASTADWQWSEAELFSVPAETTILHSGSLASWLAPGAARIADLVARVRAAGTILISYDPNVRPDLMGPSDLARGRIEASVASAHVVKASDQDVGWLYPGAAVDDVAAAWLQLGTELVVITQGAERAPMARAWLGAARRTGCCSNRHGLRRGRIDGRPTGALF